MGRRLQGTESEQTQDASDAHLNPEEIGKFTNGELSAAENQRAQEHLATCDQCRSDLVARVRLAAVELTEEERQLLQSVPRFESREQIESLLSLSGFRPSPKPSWLERLRDSIFPQSAPEPALARTEISWKPQRLLQWFSTPALVTALIVIGILGSFGGYDLYVRHQINNELEYGYTTLKQNWTVSAEDFRPAKEFEPSLFSKEHGPAPATDPAAQAFANVLERDGENREALLGLAMSYS